MGSDSKAVGEALLTLRFGREEEREAAAGQLMAAGTIDPGRITDGLKAAFEAGDADARWWVARTLAAVPGRAAGKLLVEILADPDEDVRACGVMSLGERREAGAVDNLFGLLRHTSGYLGRHVSDALSKIGEPAVPGLMAALEDPSPAVRAQAARALVRIESQQAIPALIKALDDPEPTVEHYAWEALQRMGVGVTILFRP